MKPGHPYPYRRSTVLVDLLTGDEVLTLTDELDGVVAAKTPRADVVLFRHADLAPGLPTYTKESYSRTTVSVAAQPAEAHPHGDAADPR